MKRLITICAAAIILLTVNVNVKAVPVTFNFDPSGSEPALENTNNQTTIGNYMTYVYGDNTITVSGAEVRDNQDGDSPQWSGHGSNDNFMRNDTGSGSFSITFVDVPITSVEFLAYIFDTTGPVDFGLDVYDSSNNLVGFTYSGGTSPTATGTGYLHWDRNTGQFSSPLVSFNSPVTKLVFHDEGSEDIGIDNLTVTPIPEPATICLLGLGALSLLRRKRGA
jgi:hypothetical protein